MKDLILRDYQEAILGKLREGFIAGHNAQILYAPTGAGKTICAIDLLSATMEKGNRSAMVLDRRVLVEQTSARLDEFGVDHGVMMAGHWRYKPHKPIQICSAQTLEKRGAFPGLKLLIVDEAHQTRRQTLNFIHGNPGVKVIGLTATPFTKGLAHTYTNVATATTTSELVNGGSLVPLSVYIAKEIDMTGAKKVAGEWSQKEATTRGMTITGDVVAEWEKKTHELFGRARKTIVFCAGVAHGQDLAEKFNAAGYNFVCLSYKDEDEFKSDAIEEFSKPDSSITGLIATDILTKGFDCLSSDTEILTPSGWRGMKGVRAGDDVYALNKATGAMEVVPALSCDERPVRDGERMVTLKSQRFNIRVTEGHRFHIKYRDPAKGGARSRSWITKTGAQMVRRRSAWSMPLSAEAEFPGVPLTDDELRLIAWFMTDGSINRATLSICQSKPYKTEIRALLQRLGLDFKERTRDSGGYAGSKPAQIFEIPKGVRTGSLARLGWGKLASYLSKEVSPRLHAMTRRQFGVFWEELLKGDGARQDGKAGWLWCDRASQADAYTQMAVVRGYGASFSTRTTANGHTMYVVSCRDAQWIGTDPTTKLAARFEFATPTPDERVWCVKNRLDTLVTRRGGKIAILGNCPDVMIGISARPFSKSLSSHIQQMGRVMRSAPGKEFAVWLDHSGNYLRFREQWDKVYAEGVDRLDEGQEKPQKEPSEREKEEAKCPQCQRLWPANSDICPSCGHVRMRRNDVVAVAGELVALEGGKATKATKEDKQFWYAALGTIARERGYNMGWRSHKYKEKFGVWPRGLSDVSVDPTPEVLRWVKSQQIRYAKRRRA